MCNAVTPKQKKEIIEKTIEEGGTRYSLTGDHTRTAKRFTYQLELRRLKQHYHLFQTLCVDISCDMQGVEHHGICMNYRELQKIVENGPTTCFLRPDHGKVMWRG